MPKAGCLGCIGGITPVGNTDAFLERFIWLVPPSTCFSSCPVERSIIGVVECKAMRVPLTQPGPVTFFR